MPLMGDGYESLLSIGIPLPSLIGSEFFYTGDTL